MGGTSTLTTGFQWISQWDGAPYDEVCSELAARFGQRIVCPVFGAGVSVNPPANLPQARPLMDGLVSVFKNGIDVALELTGLPPSTAQAACNALSRARFERLLDALHATHGRSALDYVSCLNGDRWNINHASLAALSAADLLPVCVTLNFDLLIEYAILASSSACLTQCPLIDQHFSTGRGTPKTTIIKPHGSFTPFYAGSDPYAHLSATLSQVGTRPSSRNERALSRAIDHGSLVLVAGYSDDDWDIFPILQNLARIIHGWIEKAALVWSNWF